MLNLDFSSAISGTVEDKDLEGTGFTTVQSNNNGDQYNPSRINLDPTAGTLALTATQGSSAGLTNTLKNALQVGTVGTQPDPNYQGFAYDFGRNRSPNGVIEYKSDTFGGALKNKMLVVEYIVILNRL